MWWFNQPNEAQSVSHSDRLLMNQQVFVVKQNLILCVNCLQVVWSNGEEKSFLPGVDFFFTCIQNLARIVLIIEEGDKNTGASDSWSAGVLGITETSGRRGIMQTPTWFNIITADVIENVLRFKEGYLNKSHYQYAEAVFTSQRQKVKQRSEREEKEWMTKRRQGGGEREM